jgi:TOMM system kinase/cyclase fusion protein
MTYDEVLAQVIELLQRDKRIAYRVLKRRFELDDEYIEDLKADLIDAKELACDQDGKVLVWRGSSEAPSAVATDATPAAPATPPRTAEAERRQLTVMFCDLVGSTPLAEKLDPEELRQVILAYQQVCAEEIRRFDGYLARYVGDGLLVYFGYPQAHEDDAQRAIRAGLGIVVALPELNTQLQQTTKVLRDFPLQVRIGIHTGLVVVGDMGGGGYRDPRAIVGETPNIAARVQGVAEPNTVMISEGTHRLVQGLFECHARGLQALKGVSTPVPVYRVLRESEAQSRFEAAVRTGLTPLVGRDEELGLLRRRWEQAKAGEGQAVLLSGEPGIGKSRLVQTLKEQASAEGATRIEFRCSPYHQNSALYPIIDHLQSFLQFTREDSPAVKLEKLQHTLSHYRFPQADTPSLFAAVLSLPHPEGYPPLTMSPQKQKEKTQAALVAWLAEEAEQAAVFCAWEDLHWADPSTVEMLTLLLNQVSMTRLLVLLTFRPEFRPPWGNRSHLSHMTLSRLGRAEVEMMVTRVTGEKSLPLEVVQQIVAKTDGVPLFVEELTKTVMESGLLRVEGDRYVGAHDGSIPPLAIPATLQDSLMARLDRLSTVREIAQLGATIGREFTYELLHAICPLDEATLQHGLQRIVEAELLYQRGLPPQARYLFKHALIQDTAYLSLLKSTRQQYHHQIAQVLEERFPETVATQPELVAHHYTEAGLLTQAIPYWQRAGQRAVEHSAQMEAISHLTRGLELLKTLPDTPERSRQELTLHLTLGPALMATKGWAAPEVERTYTRARTLCGHVDETSELFPALWGLWVFYFIRAELWTARELGEQLLGLAQRAQDPALLLEAHHALWPALFFLGEWAPTRVHLEQGLALYDARQHGSLAFLYGGHDPGVCAQGYAAWTLWFLGYPDQAVQRSHETLALARQLSYRFNVVDALSSATSLHACRRDWQAAQEHAEAAIALSTEQGFALTLAWGTILQGWVLVEQGHGGEGIAQLRQGLTASRSTGAEVIQTFFLALLAEAYGKVGQPREGLHVLLEALEAVNKKGEHFYEAELYRLKGVLTLQSHVQAPQAEAEACFQKAIEVARQQQAKSLELRAVTSLSRLWQQQGKRVEARQLLAEVYNWFTEGFDTRDLQEAKVLLEELS